MRDAEDGVEQSLVGELRAHGAHLVRVRVRVRVRVGVRVGIRVRVGVRIRVRVGVRVRVWPQYVWPQYTWCSPGRRRGR